MGRTRGRWLVVVAMVWATGSGCAGAGNGRGGGEGAAARTGTGEPPLALMTSELDFHRAGGRTPPIEREILHIDADGSYTLWRTVAQGAVGRFAGTLTDDQQEALAADLEAMEGDPADEPAMPGAPAEVLTYGGRTLRFGGAVPPPFTRAFDRLRALLDTLMDSPSSALRLEVVDGEARLVFAGDEPLDVDLSLATVTATLVGPGYDQRGNWAGDTSELRAQGKAEAGPGWAVALPFETGFDPGPDEVVQVTVTLALQDGAVVIPVQVSHAPAPPAGSSSS